MLTAMVEALRDAIPAEPAPRAAVEAEPAHRRRRLRGTDSRRKRSPTRLSRSHGRRRYEAGQRRRCRTRCRTEPSRSRRHAAEPDAGLRSRLSPAHCFAAMLPELTLMRESSLLASMERIEARPFPPPDEGTAVIFTARPMAQEPPTAPGCRRSPSRWPNLNLSGTGADGRARTAGRGCADGAEPPPPRSRRMQPAPGTPPRWPRQKPISTPAISCSAPRPSPSRRRSCLSLRYRPRELPTAPPPAASAAAMDQPAAGPRASRALVHQRRTIRYRR